MKKKAGQGQLRLTKSGSATSRDARPWVTSSPAFSSTGICGAAPRHPRCAEHPDPGRTGRQRTAVRRSGDHLGALDVSTGVWGGDQLPCGARGPQPRTRRPPSGCCAATGSLSPQWRGRSASPATPSGAPSRRSSGQDASTLVSLQERRDPHLILPQPCPTYGAPLTNDGAGSFSKDG